VTDTVKVVSRSSGSALAGPLWFGGWMFTIGYLKLAFMKALFALVLWPWYLGVTFRPHG